MQTNLLFRRVMAKRFTIDLGLRNRHQRDERGFTLVELMIVLGVVAIIAAIAYPSYANYVMRAKRADGKEMLMRVATAQERYYTTWNRYGSLTDIGISSGGSERGHYEVSVSLSNNDQSYKATAAPLGSQVADKCGSLSIDNAGGKTPAATDTSANSNGRCW